MVLANTETLNGRGPIYPLIWLGQFGAKRLTQSKEFTPMIPKGTSAEDYASAITNRVRDKLEEKMKQVLQAPKVDEIDTELTQLDGPERFLVKMLIEVLKPARTIDENLEKKLRESPEDSRIKKILQFRRLERSPTVSDRRGRNSGGSAWGFMLQSEGIIPPDNEPDGNLLAINGVPIKLVLKRLIPSDGAAAPSSLP